MVEEIKAGAGDQKLSYSAIFVCELNLYSYLFALIFLFFYLTIYIFYFIFGGVSQVVLLKEPKILAVMYIL